MSRDGWKDGNRKKISWLLPARCDEKTLSHRAGIALKHWGGKTAQTSAENVAEQRRASHTTAPPEIPLIFNDLRSRCKQKRRS